MGHLTPNDAKPIAIAVICEKWTNANGEVLDTFIQMTAPANALISKITDRMPAILQPDDWAKWLGETDASLAELKTALRTFEDGGNWTMTEQEPTRKAKASKLIRSRDCVNLAGQSPFTTSTSMPS